MVIKSRRMRWVKQKHDDEPVPGKGALEGINIYIIQISKTKLKLCSSLRSLIIILSWRIRLLVSIEINKKGRTIERYFHAV